MKLNENRQKNPTKILAFYNIGYITIKKIDDYENINFVNPLHLIIGKADRYIKENNYLQENKFVFTSTDGNKKVLTKFTKLWDKWRSYWGNKWR